MDKALPLIKDQGRKASVWIGKMRSLETFIFLLSAGAAVVVVSSNPCLNNEDVFFPDPEGDVKLRKLTLCGVTQCFPCM